jgi:hypothetical protein
MLKKWLERHHISRLVELRLEGRKIVESLNQEA